LQSPAPLPLPIMFAQRCVRLANSPGLSNADRNWPSVRPKLVALLGKVWEVTAQASIPGARLFAAVVMLAGLQVWLIKVA
jgi:hypothetical protein